jgi:hypothetical protein
VQQACNTSGLAQYVEAVGDGFQVVVEQVGVEVKRHRRGRMTEHPLDRLDVRSG